MRVRTVGLEARSRAVLRGGRTEAYEQRAPLRDAIAALDDEGTLEVEPDEGETLRRLKVMARRAAMEVGREVEHGDTEQGTLVVWLAQRQRRRRRRRGAEQEQEGDLLAAQEEMLP